jgi:hypothetical protein
VHISKAQKIDQQQSYPCPCPRKHGKLIPITLTDALGCDRCSLIFVIEDSGFSLVQLGGVAPYRCAWQWIGSKWQATHNTDKKMPVESSIFMLLAFMGFLVTLLAIKSANVGSFFGLMGAAVLVIFLILVTWWLLVLRRRDF